MERLKPPTLEKRAKQVLSVADVERLFAEINTKTFLGARMYAMLTIFYDSGVRLNEVVGLDLQDIDWQAFQMRVRGKGKQHRWVPFGAATHRALRKYLLLREQFAVEGEHAVFISTRGSRLGDDATYHLIKRLGERAGIPRLHPHLLRHSAAVAYIMNGGTPFELKRMLGHKQLSTTDIYMEMAESQLSQQHKKFSPMGKVDERWAKPTSAAHKHRAAGNLSARSHKPWTVWLDHGCRRVVRLVWNTAYVSSRGKRHGADNGVR